MNTLYRVFQLGINDVLGYECELVVNHWPADVIRSTDLQQIVLGENITSRGVSHAAYVRTLEQFGIVPRGTIRLGGEAFRVVILRNVDRWRDAYADEIRQELEKVNIGIADARSYLDDLIAE